MEKKGDDMKTIEKTEEIAKEIEKLSASIRRFRDGRLNQRCVSILLRDITGLGLNEINAVLNGAAELDKKYLKKPKL